MLCLYSFIVLLCPKRFILTFNVSCQYIQNRHPQVVIKNSYPLVCALRKIKSPGEIEAVRRAMQITEAGIRQMMQIGRPGRMEYEMKPRSTRCLPHMDSAERPSHP